MEQQPTRTKKSFTCPNLSCRAHSQQDWFKIYGLSTGPICALEYEDDYREAIRNFVLNEGMDEINMEDYKDVNDHFVDRAITVSQAVETNDLGLISQRLKISPDYIAANGMLSKCQVCGKTAIWIGSQIVYPRSPHKVPEPNADLPEEVLSDYVLASKVLTVSAQPACALLRRSIEKLCVNLLGKKTGNLNAMIGHLVDKGLSTMAQQAFDAVRFYGNDAAHPTELDDRDDIGTALQLFDLVNIVATECLTQPRKVKEVYNRTSQGFKEQIKKRDQEASKNQN